jgi:hypothetical protein
MAALIAIPLIILAKTKIGREERAKDEALRAKNVAVRELQSLENETVLAEKEDPRQAKLAALRSLAPKFTCEKNLRFPQDAEKINSTLEIDCTQYAKTATEVQLTPRIYVHIQSEDQRPDAEELKAWLKNQNRFKVIVPGIEFVGPRKLRSSEVRYFHDNRDEADWAWLITTTLKENCVDVDRPQLVKGYEESSAIRPRHFELWLTPDGLKNFRCKRPPAAAGQRDQRPEVRSQTSEVRGEKPNVRSQR